MSEQSFDPPDHDMPAQRVPTTISASVGLPFHAGDDTPIDAIVAVGTAPVAEHTAPTSRRHPLASPGTAPVPSYLVGQDAEGHWLAVEEHGLGGGIFVSKDAALRYVQFETGHMPGSCHLASEPVGLWRADAAPGRRAA